jgi:hypothetical protein
MTTRPGAALSRANERPSRGRRRLGLLAGFAVSAAACGSAAVATGVLQPGTAHASLDIVMTGGGASTFSGTFAGHSLSGRWSPPDLAATRRMCPKAEPGALGMGGTFTGTFDGMSFVFHACDTGALGPARSPADAAGPRLDAKAPAGPQADRRPLAMLCSARQLAFFQVTVKAWFVELTAPGLAFTRFMVSTSVISSVVGGPEIPPCLPL